LVRALLSGPHGDHDWLSGSIVLETHFGLGRNCP
jgi:hypothetical protein